LRVLKKAAVTTDGRLSLKSLRSFVAEANSVSGHGYRGGNGREEQEYSPRP
jgi:hypothetical protein